MSIQLNVHMLSSCRLIFHFYFHFLELHNYIYSLLSFLLYQILFFSSSRYVLHIISILYTVRCSSHLVIQDLIKSLRSPNKLLYII